MYMYVYIYSYIYIYIHIYSCLMCIYTYILIYSYEVFCELFDPIIASLHQFTPGSTHQLRDAQTMRLGGVLGKANCGCFLDKIKTH
jgi:hypothetical protein